ncbi:DUF1616 domain-containing protein [Haloarchaeobius amylolyticus]|uniref:DUF1616 domain-containing protein n=1 Tax=Haloarchaeobius amylolyticus TaxID=1198296 RepID=UPI0036F3510E
MVAIVALANFIVFAPVIRETPLRVPIGIVFVLFAPGYALVAAFFPERGERGAETTAFETDARSESNRLDPRFWNAPWPTRIDGIERVAYAVGTSLVVVPLIAVSLDLTPWGIRLVPFMTAVSMFTLITTAVATARRWTVPAAERFRVPYRSWLATGRATLFDTRADATLNLLLIGAVVLAIGSVGYAATVLPQDDEFSAIYLLSEDGEFEADDYPTDLEAGENAEVTVGIDNREDRTVNYTVVVVEQDIESNGNDTIVADQLELDRFDVRIAAGESAEFGYELEPTMTGENVRIIWLLYLDEPPDDPSISNANRYVSLTMDGEATAENTTESVAG